MTTKIVSEQDFKREPRYVVFKFKDVEQLSDEDRKALIRLSKSIEGVRASRGKTGFQAVIVESDWPEYETVWQMIEARMTNRVSGEVDENTAKRFRGILYMLGISAPESDEALMLCQFSLLGMVRHKIQQIYNQPDRTAQLEADNKRLVALATDLLDALKDSIEVTNSPLLFGKYMPLIGIANDAILAEMEAKG